jgi:hypothetical protein
MPQLVKTWLGTIGMISGVGALGYVGVVAQFSDKADFSAKWTALARG